MSYPPRRPNIPPTTPSQNPVVPNEPAPRPPGAPPHLPSLPPHLSGHAAVLLEKLKPILKEWSSSLPEGTTGKELLVAAIQATTGALYEIGMKDLLAAVPWISQDSGSMAQKKRKTAHGEPAPVVTVGSESSVRQQNVYQEIRRVIAASKGQSSSSTNSVPPPSSAPGLMQPGSTLSSSPGTIQQSSIASSVPGMIQRPPVLPPGQRMTPQTSSGLGVSQQSSAAPSVSETMQQSSALSPAPAMIQQSSLPSPGPRMRQQSSESSAATTEPSAPAGIPPAVPAAPKARRPFLLWLNIPDFVLSRTAIANIMLSNSIARVAPGPLWSIKDYFTSTPCLPASLPFDTAPLSFANCSTPGGYNWHPQLPTAHWINYLMSPNEFVNPGFPKQGRLHRSRASSFWYLPHGILMFLPTIATYKNIDLPSIQTWAVDIQNNELVMKALNDLVCVLDMWREIVQKPTQPEETNKVIDRIEKALSVLVQAKREARVDYSKTR